jgi:hypothetical protein
MTDQELVVLALRKANRIIAAYLEPARRAREPDGLHLNNLDTRPPPFLSLRSDGKTQS